MARPLASSRSTLTGGRLLGRHFQKPSLHTRCVFCCRRAAARPAFSCYTHICRRRTRTEENKESGRKLQHAVCYSFLSFSFLKIVSKVRNFKIIWGYWAREQGSNIGADIICSLMFPYSFSLKKTNIKLPAYELVLYGKIWSTVTPNTLKIIKLKKKKKPWPDVNY